MEGEDVLAGAESILAQDSGGAGGQYGTLIIFLVFGLALYFLMIRPQSKQRKQVQQMQATLTVGDEVMTGGGLYGTVAGIEDDKVELEISPGVTVHFARAAVVRVLTRAEEEPGPAESPNPVEEA